MDTEWLKEQILENLWAIRVAVERSDDQRIELEALITEREGMVAANQNCATHGKMALYPEFSFFELAEKMRALKEVKG